MKRKPIRIDWDDLEAAFDNKNTDLAYYLDRITGHVLLEGEGENGTYDDDERYTAAAARSTDGTRAYVFPVSDDLKLQWVRAFVDEASDLGPEFEAALREAFSGNDPVPAVIEVLNRFPEGKESWYVYRTDCLHRAIESWLADNDIAFTDPPPWE
jgi:hypothetical protein